MRALLHILMLVCLPLSSAQAALLVQVSSVTDVNLGNWALGDPAINAYLDLCVYSTLSADYAVKVTKAGGYNLTGTGGSIPFSLSWDDGGIGNLGVSSSPLTNNVKLTGRAHAYMVSPVCIAGPSARLNINITQAAMQAALSGNYSGTIDIIVSAN